MNIIKAWFAERAAQLKAKKFEEAVKLVESSGLTVAEIATKAGTDYIRASDGSWRKIGGRCGKFELKGVACNSSPSIMP